EAINQIGFLAARESTIRKGGNQEALAQLEQEIRSLGVSIPRSREEAQYILQQVQQTNSENLSTTQQQLAEQRNAARAANEQVKARMETLASLRNERTRLEELRKKGHWDDLEGYLRSLRIAIQDKQHDVATRVGQEGLPIPSFEAPAGTVTAMPKSDLRQALANAIRTTEE